MSANFLSVKPDETELLLIGHPKQLSELDQFFILLHCVLFDCYVKLFIHGSLCVIAHWFNALSVTLCRLFKRCQVQ